jgi:hypothetical protein
MSRCNPPSSCQPEEGITTARQSSGGGLDFFGLGPILEPYLHFAAGLAGVAGRVDGIRESLMFIEVSAVDRIVEPNRPSSGSIVPADVKLHSLVHRRLA